MSLGRYVGFCFVALFAVSSSAESAISSIALAVTLSDMEVSPIRKVVTLLEEMKVQIAKDSEEDKTSYDKYMCWCETETSALKKAIEDGKAKIAELEAFLEEGVGLAAELKTKIETGKADIAEDQDALATAEKQRAEEAEAFAKEEADLKECVGALKDAVAVLEKVQLLQKKGVSAAELMSLARPSLLQLRHLVMKSSPAGQFRSVMQRDLFDALDALNDEAGHQGTFLPRRQLAALAVGEPDFSSDKNLPWEKTDEQVGMEAKPNDLKGMAAGAKSYNSRSGQILGILKGMMDEFATSLADAQKAELEAIISFQKLKAAKTAEIAAATKMVKAAEKKLAELEAKMAQAKKDLDAAKEKLAADEASLAQVEKMCKQAEEEYAKRVPDRAEEVQAINEALKILTSDDARDLFKDTISLLQVDSSLDQKTVSSVAAKQRRAMQQAMWKVLRVARKNKDLVLASLAIRANLDAFTKVKAMMDKMLAELQAQQKAEYEKWELCKTEIDTTEDKIKEATWTKEDLEETKLGLENTIETLKGEIEALKDDVAAMEQALKKAGEQRKAENHEFQQSVSDQRATVNILNKALARLQMYYNKAFVQTQTAAPPPVKTFAGKYEKSAGAGGAMQLLSMVIEDAERVEAELVVDEQHAQEAYAAYAQDTTDSIEASRAAIAEKSQALASTEASLSETEEALLANAAELAKLSDLLNGLHLDCDYLLKYFDIRQTARKEEMDAIVEAKAILSGADFGL